MTDMFSFIIGELCKSPTFQKALSDTINEMAKAYFNHLAAVKEHKRRKQQAAKRLERLIWSLLNRLSSLQPTKHPTGIKRAGKRTREKSLIETLLETQPITISQEVTM